MEEIKKLSVGQVVWLVTPARRGDREPKETTISKIGRKYFELTDVYHTKFYIETLREASQTNYGGTVYLSLQSYLDEREHARLSDLIRRDFGSYGKLKYNLNQLREIASIIGL